MFPELVTDYLFQFPNLQPTPCSHRHYIDSLALLSVRANVTRNVNVRYVMHYFSCSCDFVELRDSAGRIIERLSGSRNFFTITVRGDRTRILNVRFRSDGSVTGLGFLARYSLMFGEHTNFLRPGIEKNYTSLASAAPEKF